MEATRKTEDHNYFENPEEVLTSWWEGLNSFKDCSPEQLITAVNRLGNRYRLVFHKWQVAKRSDSPSTEDWEKAKDAYLEVWIKVAKHSVLNHPETQSGIQTILVSYLSDLGRSNGGKQVMHELLNLLFERTAQIEENLEAARSQVTEQLGEFLDKEA